MDSEKTKEQLIIELNSMRKFISSLEAVEGERQRVEEALKESEQFLKSALDGLSANITILDENGNILLVNKSWRWFALSNSLDPDRASEGQNYLRVCDKAVGDGSEEAISFAEGIREVISGQKEFFILEYPCDSPDEKRWFAGRVTPFPGDIPRRVVVAHEDITIRKLAEETLRESEERYRSFFTSGEAIKLIIDPTDGAIVDANPAAIEFYGYKLEKIRSMFVSELNSMSKVACLTMLGNISKLESGHHLNSHRLANGESRDLDIYTSPFYYKGNTLLMCSIHDLTEINRLQQVKDDIERIVRHNLKSPLEGIINIPLILMNDENITTDQRQMLDLITVSGEKILMQINSSLELYKIETGTYKLHSQECNPEKMIREDINLLSKGMGISPDMVIIRDNSVNVGNSKLTIQTDELLLDIILMNLLRNAVEASDSGEVLNVTIMEERGECVITLANRRAVPVEIRDRFFEKYTTAGKFGGTGLGTYSAAIMTHAIGGTISMETSDISGTKVTIRIPVCPKSFGTSVTDS